MTDLRDGVVPTVRQGVEGIGGWLILPVVHLTLNGAFILFGFVKGVLRGIAAAAPGAHVGHGVVSAAARAAAARAQSPGHSEVVSLGLFEIAFLGYIAWCLIRLFQKKKSLPRLMIGFYLTLFLIAAASAYLLTLYPEFRDPTLENAPVIGGDPIMGVARGVVVCVVWIPYFLVSARVKNTFVR